jgi:hypothetical protein
MKGCAASTDMTVALVNKRNLRVIRKRKAGGISKAVVISMRGARFSLNEDGTQTPMWCAPRSTAPLARVFRHPPTRTAC